MEIWGWERGKVELGGAEAAFFQEAQMVPLKTKWFNTRSRVNQTIQWGKPEEGRGPYGTVTPIPDTFRRFRWFTRTNISYTQFCPENIL